MNRMSATTDRIQAVQQATNLTNHVKSAEDAAIIEGGKAALNNPETGDQPVPKRDEKGQAKFASGESGLVGMLASTVFGPIGGLLIGGAYGLMKKKNDQGMLDTIMTRNNALTASADILGDQITNMEKANAGNPDNLKQIANFRTGLDMAGELLGNVSTQDGGLQLLNKVLGDMTSFQVSNETQAIQAGVQERAELRELGRDQQSDITEKRGRYEPIANSFSELTFLRNKAVAALSAENFSFADAHTGVVAYFKTGDPDSAVLGPEFDVGANFGDLITKGLSFWNSIETGNAMTSKQRNDMIRTIDRSYDIAVSTQEQHEAKFSDELADGNFPEHFYNDFQTINSNPKMQFDKVQDDVPVRIIERAQQAGATASEVREVAHEGLNKLYDILGQIYDAGGNMVSDATGSLKRKHN